MIVGALLTVTGCAAPGDSGAATCRVEVLVLGAGQDAGAPQIGVADDPGWADADARLLPTALALVDDQTDRFYLFEATPALPEQLALLSTLTGQPLALADIDGIFVTHAHIGHYTGLMYAGLEAAATRALPVYAMPRLAEFLATNGPWQQLVALGNIALRPLADGVRVPLSGDTGVTPLRVPHRDEYSETVGFVIDHGDQRVLFVPDIDSWQQWQDAHGVDIDALIRGVDLALLDATFFDDNELPGRDMSAIPHPRVRASMARFARLPAAERRKVVFIHFNHTNPLRDPVSAEHREVERRGYGIAARGDRFCLDS